MQCPRCNATNFVEHNYEGLKVDTCQSCLGVWLDEGEIAHIVYKKEKNISPELVREVMSNSFYGIPASESETILKCAKCSSEMTPINYDISSGVIIDRCPNGHGFWLDKHELEKVQAFREYWSKEVEKHRADFEHLLEQKDRDYRKQASENKKNFGLLFTLAEVFSKILK